MKEQTHDHAARAHALLSASGAHRWLACPPSAAAALRYPDESSEYATEGTRAHEVAEAIVSGMTPDDLLEHDEYTVEMVNHAIEYKDYIEEQRTSPDDLLLLETRVDFSPWVPEGFGTCDAMLIRGNVLTVIDYKYGVGVPVSAVDNPQMRLYALGALNDYGIALDVETVEMHIYQPRIHNISTDTISVDKLLRWGEKVVKPIAAKAWEGKGTYKAGDHCRFCPHAAKCRALAHYCESIVDLHGSEHAIPTLTPAEIADILTAEPVIASWLRRVKARALEELLDGKEIPGFKAVDGRLGNRQWADESRVVEILRDNGYGEDDYTERKLKSPAGMDELLGKKTAAEMLGSVTVRKPGSPTIVPDTDRRPAVTKAEALAKDYD
ncbi:MAG: DUF2800 domain-containing protein [Clostridia bacterium]|nr:DUF2800 domain-containing protein [Clostridia bacterium]